MKIAVDFDGTCVDHCFPEVGESVPQAVEVLQDLKDAGHQIFLFTMRSGLYLEDAIEWFHDSKIILNGIQSDPDQISWTKSPKCYAKVYIDDAAFGCPLIEVEGFSRSCVDWSKVREVLLPTEVTSVDE